MMVLLRKHRHWLMIVIAVLAIPFIFYFNKSDLSRKSEAYATIYGREVTEIEAQRSARTMNLAAQIGMSNYVRGLTLGANNENDMFGHFTINRIVLRHEADRLGIKPGTAEIAEFIRGLRPFRGPNGFDPKKYEEFVQSVLPSQGFNESQLADLAADELSFRRIKDLVATGVTVPEAESRREYEQYYGKLHVDVVRLKAEDFVKDIKISDDDIQKYYESHKAGLKTEEKRKVDFVALTLTDEQKKLTGKERIDVLQKLSDKSNDVSQALLEKGADFRQVAAQFQLPVDTTAEFTAAAPDPKFKGDPQVNAAAFQLSKTEPVSDPVQGPDGFYILHLAGVTEARSLTLEEAKLKIVESLNRKRSGELVAARGAAIAQSLRETLASGAPLPFALEKAGVKAEKVEPFTLAEDTDPEEQAANKDKEKPKRPADFIAIRNAAAALQPGEVADFLPWETGGVIAVLEKREAPDQSKYEQKKAAFEQRVIANKRDVVFYEWLQDRQREAGVSTAQRVPKA